MPRGLIYKLTNKINGKIYVGQTKKSVEKRWKQHVNHAKNSDGPFQKAIRKYGEESFTLEVVCECGTQKELDEKEIFWGAQFNSLVPNGYNILLGSGPQIASEEYRRRMSAVTSGDKNGMFGKTHSEEAKEKNRKAHLGKSDSEITKKRKSISRLGNKNPNFGKNHTDEVKQTIASKNSKTWYFTDPIGNIIVITNLKAFCRENGLLYQRLWEVYTGKRQQYKGWRKYDFNRLYGAGKALL